MVDFDGRWVGSTYDRPMESYWLCIVCLSCALHARMARMTCCITSMRRKKRMAVAPVGSEKKRETTHTHTHRDTQDTQSTDVLGNYLIDIFIIIIFIIVIINVSYFHVWDIFMGCVCQVYFQRICLFLRFANSKIQDCYFFKHLIALGKHSPFWYGWNPMLSIGEV